MSPLLLLKGKKHEFLDGDICIFDYFGAFEESSISSFESYLPCFSLVLSGILVNAEGWVMTELAVLQDILAVVHEIRFFSEAILCGVCVLISIYLLRGILTWF